MPRIRSPSYLTCRKDNVSSDRGRKEFCNWLIFRYIRDMPTTPPVVLTIAGFDPSSGAGVGADIKTIAAHGCYGLAAITALTVQSTQGVRGVITVEDRLLAETLKELNGDCQVSA